MSCVGFEGDKPVEKLKEDVLKEKGIAKEKARSYDIWKDKKTGDYYLRPKGESNKKLPETKIPF